jgi:hypothetical protein
VNGFGKRRIAIGATTAIALAAAVTIALTTDGAGAGPRAHEVEHAPQVQGRTNPPLIRDPIPKNALELTVGAPARVHPIRNGFLGLSIEYPSIEAYAGTDPTAINPVFVQLIRNLTPNQSPVLRIGGDSTDWEWWPVPNMRKPGGVRYTLNQTWLSVTEALTRQLDARLILGLDLEANSLPLASTEAKQFVDGFGRQSIEALEPGNEPELYGSWAWYRVPDGRRVTGRPASWNIESYERQLAALQRLLRPSPIAGPATGGPKWTAELPQFVRAATYLNLLTIHRYPLQLCYTPPSSPTHPTVAHLLAPVASRGLADGSAPYIRLGHAHGVPVRIDEMNTNSCGAAPNVTKSFASALWATDALFAMAKAGADGVNIHTYDGSSYELFTFDRTHGQWVGHVEPEYYGLYLFALAAPTGSRLLNVTGSATKSASSWATRAPDGHVRITLINDSLTHSRTVVIRPGGRATTASLIRLEAPSAKARTGVTIGGQAFGSGTTTGRPAGRAKLYEIAPTQNEYVVTVPAASAALLVR